MTAYPDDDWSGGLARTRALPNRVVSVEALDAGEAILVRLRDGTTCVLRAADVGPLVAGETAQQAVQAAIYRAALARQRLPGAA